MFKRTIFIFFILISAASGHAQEWEFGANIGAMGYIGDLNPSNPIAFNKPAAAINVRYAFTPFSALKLSFTYGGIQASDADSKFEQHRLRNLSFRTDIKELALNYEYYFYPFQPGSGKYRYTPYAFVGIAGLQFEPVATLNGVDYELRELGTEGQGTVLNSSKKYSNFALAIPFGLGIKYNFADNFNIGFELGYRNALTDYLDDVSKTYVDKTTLATSNGQIASDLSDRSGEVNGGVYVGEAFTQRGDASRRDFYMFTGITISYTLTPLKCPDIKIYK